MRRRVTPAATDARTASAPSSSTPERTISESDAVRVSFEEFNDEKVTAIHGDLGPEVKGVGGGGAGGGGRDRGNRRRPPRRR